MYKGCYQLLAGANPVTVQALLGDVGYSQLRRRALATKVRPLVCGVYYVIPLY